MSPRRFGTPWLSLLLLAAAGCDKDLGQESSGVQSFRITLKQPLPNQLGTPNNPVTFSAMTFDVDALGPDGKLITTEDYSVDVYLTFSGNKVGYVDPCGTGDDSKPLATIVLKNGSAPDTTVQLVQAYGAATLWIEDQKSKAIGTSPIIYFPPPTIPDIQTPPDLTSTTAAYCSAWNGRHVIVTNATGMGQLMVTSVFGSAFVLTDTGAQYDPAVPGSGFNNLYVYTFGQPDPQILPGLIMTNISGDLSKFVGFSELNFPLQCWATQLDSGNGVLMPATDSCSASPGNVPIISPNVPAPTVLMPGDATAYNQPDLSRLLALAGGVVTTTAQVCCIQQTAGATADQCCPYAIPKGGCPATGPCCQPDTQWMQYDTFAIDLGDGICDSFNSFAVAMTSKNYGAFDPLQVMGTPTAPSGAKKFTFTGMLKNSSGQNNVCKDSLGPVVPCMTLTDCTNAAATLNPPNPGCSAALVSKGVQCVEGTCVKGPYNFWTIVPRSPADIVAQ